MSKIKLFETLRIIGNFWILYKEYLFGTILLLLWLFVFVMDLFNGYDILSVLKSSWFLLAISLFAFLSGFLMNHVFFIKCFKSNKKNDK